MVYNNVMYDQSFVPFQQIRFLTLAQDLK